MSIDVLSICPFTSACFCCNHLSNLPAFLSSPNGCSSVYLLTEALLGSWRRAEPYPWCTFSFNINMLKHLSLFSTPEQKRSQESCTQAWACFYSKWFSCTSQVFPGPLHTVCSYCTPVLWFWKWNNLLLEGESKSSAKTGASWSISLILCIAWILLAAFKASVSYSSKTSEGRNFMQGLTVRKTAPLSQR